MFIRIRDIKIPLEKDESELGRMCAEKLCICEKDIDRIRIHKKSLDARRARAILYTYTVDVFLRNGEMIKYKLPPNADYVEKSEMYEIPKYELRDRKRPIIVGLGPSGMFCALVLARSGLKPIVIERGRSVDERIQDVEKFFKTGKLDTNSNIQFGEGGAGTFSDGKLNTLVKDKDYRGRFVLAELVRAGAPEEILYINKPHVGTDMLRKSMQNIRKEIIDCGGTVLFGHKLVSIEIANGKVCAVKAEKPDLDTVVIETDSVFLGIGHSARDTYEMLEKIGVKLERKPFAVGVRIEHSQNMIDNVQYSGVKNNKLPAADYKLVCHTKTGRTVYTFCMCPGGYVVAAASEEDMVVTNGMSNFSRNAHNANSALLVEVKPDDFEGDAPLAGMYFQRELERIAYMKGQGEYKAPAQLVGDYLKKRASNGCGSIIPTYSRGVTYTDLRNVLPAFITDALDEGLRHFDTVLHGFACEDAVMTAVESRSSSPVRITRDLENLQSENLCGLYPIGEGAGYAGGIMSAAMDGMKAAEKYMEAFGE